MGFAEKVSSSGRAIAALLSIGFIGIVFLIMFGNMSSDTIYGSHTSASADVVNYASDSVLTNDSYVSYVSTTIAGLYQVSCSLYNLTNQSTGELIGASNYTVGGTGNCYVLGTDASPYNTTLFNSTYAYTYNTFDSPNKVIANISNGTVTFFNFSNTLFTIMAITLLITILLGLLALVMKVTNMGSRNKGFSGY